VPRVSARRARKANPTAEERHRARTLSEARTDKREQTQAAPTRPLRLDPVRHIEAGARAASRTDLLQVALDGVRVANGRLVGVLAELLVGAALPQ
jgi:hypothetical protein